MKLPMIAISLNADEWSFVISLVLIVLFYLQYRIYEREIRHQKMADRFLKDR